MKKCNNTKRSNLQKNKQNTSIKTLNSGLFHYSIQDVLASGIAAWFCTRCWRIIRSFSVSFGHFHFVVDDWIVSDWLKIWRNYYTQRYTVKMTCVKSCSLLRPEKPGCVRAWVRACLGACFFSVSIHDASIVRKTKKWRLFRSKIQTFKRLLKNLWKLWQALR